MSLHRRSAHNPLASSPHPRWLKVYDRYSNELSRRELPPWADLSGELQREASRWQADGWTIEGDGGKSPWGVFFMNRDGDRRMVAILPSAEPLMGHGTGHFRSRPRP